MGLLLGASSCSKWLNVQPEDRYTQEQVYTSAQGFEEALNGVYLQLSSDNLYGDNLTLSIPDALSQLYKTNLTSSHPLYSFGNYSYADKDVKARFSKVWSQAYLSIANINKVLENVEKKGSTVLTEDRAKTMKGELLGLRAFIHFDLLRLFGPVYDGPDSTLLSIPYYKNVDATVNPFLPANEIMAQALTDIENALPLLKTDPAKEIGYRDQNNLRFNYYAVLGTKARMLLWRKDKIGALRAAKEVTANADLLFPWIQGPKITADTQNPDRIFYTELIFAAYSRNLYENYNKYFYFEQTSSILAGGSSEFIDRVFEKKTADYRNSYIWKSMSTGVPYPSSFKYADIQDKRQGVQQQRNLIPLIRLSEMYYILSETEENPQQALTYLNTVLNKRGLSNLTESVNLQDEILKEYRKEFYCEGQLWYYYKRRKINNILSSLSSSYSETIPKAAWVVPIPDEELENR